MDEQDFKRQSTGALEQLYRKLSAPGEQYAFEADFNSGALAIEFEEPPGKFVVSPNAPVRQIWVSAHSRSFKLEWNDARAAFVYPETGETLDELIAGAVSKQLGRSITL